MSHLRLRKSGYAQWASKLAGHSVIGPITRTIFGEKSTPKTQSKRRASIETLEQRHMLAADPIINEFMASNDSTLADGNGEFSDWIEIYNAGDESVNLSGWHLSDSSSDLEKWDFPSKVLEAGGFLVVFASGTDTVDPENNLHTNFKLSSDGDYIALVRPDLTIASEFGESGVDYIAQQTDVSFGIAQDVVVESLTSFADPAQLFFPTDNSLGTTWTGGQSFNDTGWLDGTSAAGYELAVPGFTVRNIHSSGSVSNLAAVDSLIAGNSIFSETTVIAPFVDYLDGGGAGRFGTNSPFPDGGGDDFIIHATGTITIPAGQSGTWSFGVNSDDGSRVLIDGNAVITDNTLHGAADRFGSTSLTVGVHTIDLVFFERGGGATVELFATKGSFGSFNSSFKLIGDVDSGGLEVKTIPNSTALSAGFGAFIDTNVLDPMFEQHSTLMMRIPFDVSDASQFESLSLRMRYDDGFVAYLNGVEVARRNAPDTVEFDSVATADRPNAQAILNEDINISSHLGLLKEGQTNILAIYALNEAVDGNEFLISVELAEITIDDSARRFFPEPTPGQLNTTTPVIGFLGTTSIDVDGGFFTLPFEASIDNVSPNLVGVEIRYTTDGSEPSERNGTIYDGPITISGTTVLRAAAFKTGFETSNVDTRSYFFVDDIVGQTRSSTIAAGFPSSNVNGQTLRYGLNAGVLNEWSEAAVKEALLSVPTMSIVTDVDNLFDRSSGIYVNPGAHGKAWERSGSLELLNPDGTEGFQVEMGLRVRGGFSRSGGNPKHAFRLFFRKEYGDSKLNYPLFGDEGVDQFDKFDLRTTQNYSWAFQNDNRNAFVRDVFSRDAQGIMGQPYTRSRFYQLYINGVYWGLYQTQERVSDSFAASYLGGEPEDYDVVKSTGSSGGYVNEATDGTLTAYRRLWEAFDDPNSGSSIRSGRNNDGRGLSDNAAYYKIQGMNPDGTRNPAYERLLDVDNVIDYAILTYYTGDRDGPGSRFTTPGVNNYYGTFNKTNPDGFKFYEHDSEHSLGTGENNMVTPLTSGGDEFSRFNPHWMHEKLARTNEEYRTRFSDRLYKYFNNDGVLTRDSADALIDSRSEQIESAIIAESARWGTTSLDKTAWESAVRGVHSFIRNRIATVLNQVKGQNWYLETVPPTLGHPGGNVSEGFQLGISGTQGTVYYTIDGSDPRSIGGAISPSAMIADGQITISGNTQVRTRAFVRGDWSPIVESTFVTHIPALRVTELHYNPAEPSPTEVAAGFIDNDEFEFIELQNTGAESLNIAGFQLTNGVEFTFGNVDLAPNERIVVVRNIDAFTLRYGNSINVAGSYGESSPGAGDGFKLDNSGEKIALIGAVGEPIQEFSFRDGWHPLTDSEGFSLTIIDSLGELDSWNSNLSWRPSDFVGGSPGGEDVGIAPAPGDVLINEVLANTVSATGDVIELYNSTDQPIDVNGWWLTDDQTNLSKHVLAGLAPIPADGYLLLDAQNHFGAKFLLASTGGRLILQATDDSGEPIGFRTKITYQASTPETTQGYYLGTDGEQDFVTQIFSTLGSDNSDPLVSPVVISEIMYHPGSGGDEFIELHNTSDATVSLDDWSLTNGVVFDLSGESIPAGGYVVVVGIEPDLFRQKHGISAGVTILGPYLGTLDNNGETLTLSQTAAGDLVIPMDRIQFNDKTPWPETPDGQGQSLSRLDSTAFGNDPINWSAGIPGGTPGDANLLFDETPPSVPGGIAVTAVAGPGLLLDWDDSLDTQTGVKMYVVYRDDAVIALPTDSQYVDNSAVPGVTHTYRISAINGSDVESLKSSPVIARLLDVDLAVPSNSNQVFVNFSERVSQATAENIANYKISNLPITITGAVLQPGGTDVLLTTSETLVEGQPYRVVASGIAGLEGGSLVPDANAVFVPGVVSGGVSGAYFNNIDLSGAPVLQRTDNGVNFNWGSGSPDPLVNVDNFSARWTGSITPEFGQTYEFRVLADDKARLWINEVLVIDMFTNPLTTVGSINLSQFAGKPIPFKLEMAETTGNARMQLAWKSSGQPLQIVPAVAFSTSADLETDAPAVNSVQVSSSAWLPEFIAALDSAGMGSGGIDLPVGAVALDGPLNWPIDQVSIAFDEDMKVEVDDLVIPGHAIVSVAYDVHTFTATWTLAEPALAENMQIQIASGLTDLAGNVVPGDPNVGVVSILAGDVDGSGAVDNADLRDVMRNQFATAGDAAYSLQHDLNGDGVVNFIDLIVGRDARGGALPAAAPAASPLAPAIDQTAVDAALTLETIGETTGGETTGGETTGGENSTENATAVAITLEQIASRLTKTTITEATDQAISEFGPTSAGVGRIGSRMLRAVRSRVDSGNLQDRFVS